MGSPETPFEAELRNPGQCFSQPDVVAISSAYILWLGQVVSALHFFVGDVGHHGDLRGVPRIRAGLLGIETQWPDSGIASWIETPPETKAASL